MSRQDELVEGAKRLLLNNYRQAPVVMTRGEGCVRLSFASAQADLDAAVTRIGDAVASLAS